jgi:L-ribulose-5-phosphate 3-epimerase UlaE
MLFLTLIFLGTDVYYLAYAMQAKEKFPEKISEAVRHALFGSMEKMNLELYESVKKAR